MARDDRAAELTEREAVEALAHGLRGAGLPLATSGEARPRPRLSLAAPLPRGATADSDLVELYLSARLRVEVVRSRVVAGLPEGFRLMALEDEWVGAPSLASSVTSMVYRIEVAAARTFSRGELEASIATANEPGTAGRVHVDLIGWHEGLGRGTLELRVKRDETGRIARPAAVIAALGMGLRVVGITRTAIEVADGAGRSG